VSPSWYEQRLHPVGGDGDRVLRVVDIGVVIGRDDVLRVGQRVAEARGEQVALFRGLEGQELERGRDPVQAKDRVAGRWHISGSIGWSHPRRLCKARRCEPVRHHGQQGEEARHRDRNGQTNADKSTPLA
jgi:hypothetical protein